MSQPISPSSSRLAARASDHAILDVAADVVGLQTQIVNLYFIATDRPGSWVLVDAGMPLSAARIIRTAEELFGKGTRPDAIILTHGHFDHVGSLHALLKHWDAPVYAHDLEFPYISGQSPYPPPDPTVGGGLMARTSPLFPRGPSDFGRHLQPLPPDNTIPHLPGWRWVHTPGHAPGHVSLFRDEDRLLIVGDAFVTTRQESVYYVLTQKQELNGPPKYYTIDWAAARSSVERLAALDPSVAATGHGLPMGGVKLTEGLRRLTRLFNEIAVPEDGRYVYEPAITDLWGIVSIPPKPADPVGKIVIAAAIATGIGAILFATRRRHSTKFP